MKKTLIISMCFIAFATQLHSQIFNEVSSSLNDYWYPSSDIADIDNDGDKDLVIMGALDTNNDASPNQSKIDFYENVNGVLTLITQTNVGDLHLGSVKFLDIDNDGDQDLITAGQNYNDITTYALTVYENTNGNFSVKQQLEGVIYSSIDVGDYDNDGDLDVLVSGAYQASGGASVYTRIYNNVNGTFSDANANLPGVQNGNAVFADSDNDADLDVVISGYNSTGDNFATLYTNTDGSFTEAALPFNTGESWIAMGDYDNDGDLDLAYTGYNDDYDSVTKLYNNDGNGVFVDTAITFEGVTNSSGNRPIIWGDYDNDGDLDLVYAGSNNDYDDITYLYNNDGGAFSLASEGLINLGSYANLKFFDSDGDNDLDLLISGGSDADGYVGRTRLFENTVATSNIKPNAPTNLSSVINDDDSITFSWDSATDDFTPSNGLFYMLTVGTTENGSEVASYPVHGTTWTIQGLGGAVNYYWSVSAIDTAFVASDLTTSETHTEQVISIGTETEGTTGLPIDPFYMYSYSQEIYLASEINTSGSITQLAFKVAPNRELNNSNEWVVYLAHTSKTAFDDTDDWVALSALTQVYSGTFVHTPGADVILTFDTPFDYNGTDNLLIAVEENQYSFDSGADDLLASSVSGNRAIMFRSDDVNPEPNNPPTATNIQAFVANVDITFGADTSGNPCDMPQATIDDDFESYAAGVGEPLPDCWSSVAPGGMVIGNRNTAGEANSGINYISVYVSIFNNQDGYIITPKLSTIDGAHEADFMIKSSIPGATYELGTMSDPTDSATFTSLGSPVALSTTYTNVNTGAVAASSDEYFAIRFTASVQHSVIRIDDFKWQEASLSVNELATTSFSVYPNPSLDKKINLVYDSSLDANDNKVIIYTTMGQVVFKADLTSSSSVHTKTIDLSQLNSGVYLLQFSSGDYTITKKIILK